MAELPDDDFRVLNTARLLTNNLATYLMNTGRRLTFYDIEKMKQMISEASSAFKRDHGYDFPRVTPFILPTLNSVSFLRADLTNEEIRRKLLMMLKQFAQFGVNVPAIEIAKAVALAWPNYRPEPDEIKHRQDLISKSLN